MLLAFFSARGGRAQRVAAGYLGSQWLVVGVAWGASRFSKSLPQESLGYLGVVPIGLGIWRAWQLRGSARTDAARSPATGGALEVSLVNSAQNSDNLAVFTCLFADSAQALHGAVLGTLAASAAAWCGLGFWLARRTRLAQPLRRASRFALPFLLIAVGVYILADTATDVIQSPGETGVPVSHP